MKKTIPMQKEIMFRTMIGEMTELSVEHNLSFVSELSIEGNLIVSGRYKMTEASTIEEEFQESVPVNIELDSKYDTSSVEIDLSDFYYEIINDNILRVHVEFSLDGLEEKVPEVEEAEIEVEDFEEDILGDLEEPVVTSVLEGDSVSVREVSESTLPAFADIPTVEAEPIPVEIETSPVPVAYQNTPSILDKEADMGSIFTALQNTEETFSTYYVYIVRENDTVEHILDKYKISRDSLACYNQLEEIKVGSKLIIPCVNAHESH